MSIGSRGLKQSPVDIQGLKLNTINFVEFCQCKIGTKLSPVDQKEFSLKLVEIIIEGSRHSL